MSDAVGGSAPASAPSHDSPSPAAQGQEGKARTHDDAVRDLRERTQKRRLDAERAAGFPDVARDQPAIADDERERGPKDGETRARDNEQGERGPDGKFLPRNGAPKTARAPKTGTDAIKAVEAEVSEPKAKPDAEGEKRYKALEEKHKAAEGKNAEWEKMAEQVIARIDTYKKRIDYLEGKLSEHGGQPDPLMLENLSHKEKLRVYELQEERARAEKEANESSTREKQLADDRQQLRGELARVWQTHPELRPPFSEHNQEAGAFWSGLLDEVKAGRGSYAELAPRLAVAQYIAQAIKGKNAQKSQPAMAPRVLTRMGSSGGEAKVIDRQSVTDKWKSRLRAV